MYCSDALGAALGAEAVIGAEFVAAAGAECRQRRSRRCDGCRGRASLLRGAHGVGRLFCGCRSRSGCGGRCRRCLRALNTQRIVFVMAQRGLALGAIHKAICIPGAEIQRIIRVLQNRSAALASLLISQAAVPFCSFVSHVNTSFPVICLCYSFVPHRQQNAASASAGVPHCVQNFCAFFSFVPQPEQN